MQMGQDVAAHTVDHEARPKSPSLHSDKYGGVEFTILRELYNAAILHWKRRCCKESGCNKGDRRKSSLTGGRRERPSCSPLLVLPTCRAPVERRPQTPRPAKEFYRFPPKEYK